MITLQRLMMVRLNSQDIYAPSRIAQPETICYQEFLAKYADYPIRMLVSFAPDGFSDPQPLTAYGLMSTWMVSNEQ